MAIGVGKESIATVVLQGWLFLKYVETESILQMSRSWIDKKPQFWLLDLSNSSSEANCPPFPKTIIFFKLKQIIKWKGRFI